MFSAPERSERNTMRLPSGDQRGGGANAGPAVSRVAAPPTAGSVYRSPSSSNTIVRPSGDTSSDSQVPSDVSNSMVRVVTRGSSSFLFFLLVSGGAAAAASAERGGASVSAGTAEGASGE